MTTLEKMRTEIAENQKVISETLSFDKENEFYNGKWAGFELALAIIDKYAEQEPTDDATLKDIFCMWCEYKEQEPCDDVVSRQAVLDLIDKFIIPIPTMGGRDLNAETNSHLRQVKRNIEQLPPVRPQPCDDAISREELLKAIDTWDKFGYSARYGLERLDKDDKGYVPYIHYDDVIKSIKGMQSVTPQPKVGHWIPVSEGLPEDRREVLVTAYWHETYQVMMASYYGDGLWWCVPFNNCGEHMQRLNPKAWMPLPELYKIESEDKK